MILLSSPSPIPGIQKIETKEHSPAAIDCESQTFGTLDSCCIFLCPSLSTFSWILPVVELSFFFVD
jgi:hypothetical protein